MNVPRFSAEDSLYRSFAPYYSIVSKGHAAGNVHLALFVDDCTSMCIQSRCNKECSNQSPSCMKRCLSGIDDGCYLWCRIIGGSELM